MKYLHWWLLMIAVGILSCNKDDTDQTPTPIPAKVNSISFRIQYDVDGQSVIRDSIMYLNAAGNPYSIHNLMYYLSEISLINYDGIVVKLKNVQYVDCFDSASNLFTIKNLPAGNYSEVKFNIGIDSLYNVHDSLENSIENSNMEWPDPMGGGFHFLRLEGYFTDAGTSYGYAMHVGTNSCLIPVMLAENFTVTSESNTELILHMNVNEWFCTPNTYDFNIDGNYTMGNIPLMLKIAANGQDVFTL